MRFPNTRSRSGLAPPAEASLPPIIRLGRQPDRIAVAEHARDTFQIDAFEIAARSIVEHKPLYLLAGQAEAGELLQRAALLGVRRHSGQSAAGS